MSATEEIDVATFWRLQPGQPKYGNTRIAYAGYTFDSLTERNYYQMLRLEEQSGLITGLLVHPSYELQAAFRDRNGKKHRAIVYEADFSFYQGDALIVIDVKGHRTKEFCIKEKLFRFRYSDIDFRLVKA